MKYLPPQDFVFSWWKFFLNFPRFIFLSLVTIFGSTISILDPQKYFNRTNSSVEISELVYL